MRHRARHLFALLQLGSKLYMDFKPLTGHVHNMRVSEASDKSGTCEHTLVLATVRSNSRALDTGSDG